MECLPPLGQNVVMLANIDMNNGSDSNKDKSKDEELNVSLNTDSDGEINRNITEII